MGKGNGELSYEAISERLEVIAEKLETGDTELEEALALYEEGVKLAKLGTQRLDEAERRIERLLQDDTVAPLVADTADTSDE